jgi:glycerol-3-phosphate acyltransferase PlsY
LHPVLGPIGSVSATDLGIFKFKEGKGVSAAMGGVSALIPGQVGTGILLWLVIFHATGFVSVASLFFAMSLTVTSFAFGYDMPSVVLAIAMGLVIFWRHRGTIGKLWDGSEHRFERK